MADKDPLSPATTSLAYDAMSNSWQMLTDLLGGTESMRAGGGAYLPQHSEETDSAYQARLSKATLNNVFERTLNNLSSKPFSEELKVNDDVPAVIQPFMDDIDLQGNKLAVFTREWFKTGLHKGLCHVLIDLPRLDPSADGGPRTLADDRTQNVRPYWCLVRPENVIFMEVECIDGVETLTHLRILEVFTERVGFAEVVKKRIRVLEPGTVTIWEPTGRQKNGVEEWAQTDAYSTGFFIIPFVTFYANDHETPGLVKPPLLDLAYMNVKHWRSTSEQDHALTVARFPILACSGATEEDSDPVVVGPNKVLYNGDPQGKFYYVEHTGAAIEAGRQSLEDLENAMADYGAEFLKDRPGDITATSKAIDSAESSSDLASIVGVFEDAVAAALTFTAELARAGDKGGTIELVKSYTPDLADQPGLAALGAARLSKDISRETYLNGLVLRGVLPEDFDLEANLEQLQDEADQALEQAVTMGTAMGELDPGAPAPAPAPGAPSPSPASKKPPTSKAPTPPTSKTKKGTK